MCACVCGTFPFFLLRCGTNIRTLCLPNLKSREKSPTNFLSSGSVNSVRSLRTPFLRKTNFGRTVNKNMHRLKSRFGKPSRTVAVLVLILPHKFARFARIFTTTRNMIEPIRLTFDILQSTRWHPGSRNDHQILLIETIILRQ